MISFVIIYWKIFDNGIGIYWRIIAVIIILRFVSVNVSCHSFLFPAINIILKWIFGTKWLKNLNWTINMNTGWQQQTYTRQHKKRKITFQRVIKYWRNHYQEVWRIVQKVKAAALVRWILWVWHYSLFRYIFSIFRQKQRLGNLNDVRIVWMIIKLFVSLFNTTSDGR